MTKYGQKEDGIWYYQADGIEGTGDTYILAIEDWNKNMREHLGVPESITINPIALYLSVTQETNNRLDKMLSRMKHGTV